MFGYIYRTYHEATGYYYIGRHISDHFTPRYKGSGVQLKKMWKIYHRAEWEVEILETADNLEDLNKAEERCIGKLYETDPLCLNRIPGGRSGDRHSELAIKHMQEAFEAHRATRVFKYHDNYSEKGLERLRDMHLGAKNPQYGKKGKLSASSIPVYCHELDKVFAGGWEANRETGVAQQNIWKVCNGWRKTAGGYHWSYADETKSDKKN